MNYFIYHPIDNFKDTNKSVNFEVDVSAGFGTSEKGKVGVIIKNNKGEPLEIILDYKIFDDGGNEVYHVQENPFALDNNGIFNTTEIFDFFSDELMNLEPGDYRLVVSASYKGNVITKEINFKKEVLAHLPEKKGLSKGMKLFLFLLVLFILAYLIRKNSEKFRKEK